MGKREERHGERRRLAWLGDLLVVTLLVLAVASAYFDLGDRLGLRLPDPRREPALVLPPPGLDLPEPVAPSPVAARTATTGGDPVRVQAALRPFLRGKELGRHVRVVVTDLDGDRLLMDAGSGPVTPASTLKVLTSIAALETLGADRRFETRVVREGGTLTLVGGGDPLLTSATVTDAYPRTASLQTLADRTARAVGRGPVRLAYDDTLFVGPSVNPAWPADYVPDEVVPPIVSLWDDRGRAPSYGFVRDPSRDAADDFAALLRQRGVAVRGAPTARPAGQGAGEVAAVRGPDVGEIVERLLVVSDNNTAEVLAHQVAIAEGLPATFEGGATAMRRVLARLGLPVRSSTLYDGSGLSRQNLVEPALLAAAVRLAASSEHPELRRVVSGMPVAGFTGSLDDRFLTGDRAGLGRVQAKTGTLRGIHGLAGVVTDLTGTSYAFVMVADKAPPPRGLDTRDAIDRAAAALAACTCSRGPAASAGGTP